jgi:hypothetical protein
MSRPALVLSLWLVFAFVAWNVIFDRLVWVAATEFTRDQIARQHEGRALITIHDGFSPRVGTAAWQASLWTLPIMAAGAAATYFSVRRAR